MAWLAPTSRSSGGRSAVSTSSGTRASCASTTAGSRFAAALPDVHVTATGRPVAFAIPRPGAEIDEAAVIAHCGRRLAKYKVPIRVFAIESFPVTDGPNGTKIQKNRLQELARRRLAEAQAEPGP